MSVFFGDTSALAKRYVTETGSAWLMATINPKIGSRVYIAHITIVEIVSAITRKERGGHLSASDAQTVITTFEQDYFQEFSIVPLTTSLVDEAKNLAKKYRYAVMMRCSLRRLCKLIKNAQIQAYNL